MAGLYGKSLFFCVSTKKSPARAICAGVAFVVVSFIGARLVAAPAGPRGLSRAIATRFRIKRVVRPFQIVPDGGYLRRAFRPAAFFSASSPKDRGRFADAAHIVTVATTSNR